MILFLKSERYLWAEIQRERELKKYKPQKRKEKYLSLHFLYLEYRGLAVP